MKKILVVASALLLVLGLVAQVSGASSRNNKLLEFGSMIGVSGPFVAANPINGVTGAGAAWRVDSARGELRSDGSLEVEVKGLVLVNTGMNPSPTFRAAVACQTISNGQAATASDVTGPFPATMQGDSEIEATVNVPSPCFDPAVFVTNGAGTRWFAVTGQ